MENHFDLLVIGGGINGAGIARDAAGRGLSVCLVEKDDLASATSSASTKLIHGGLRYLEHYEFRLVRESLIERERLLAMAPHIIWPMRFVLPHDEGLRPAWMLRLGLFLYDNLGGRKILPGTKSVNLREEPHAKVLKQRLTRGWEYSDCWVEDSRLVVLNCMDAKERGADIRTRTECVALDRREDRWIATLRTADGREDKVIARKVVNAAGPWVDTVLGRAVPDETHQNLRLVKGSHLIFPKLFDHDRSYIFQNKDDRIIFAIPYERDFTLVGTTDQAFEGDPKGIDISAQEASYICDAVNEYLAVSIAPEQAAATYAGVRPLYEDKAASNSTVTRDYQFEVDEDGPPLLSIFGGKLTTYRKLAEHALERLGIGGKSWTASEPLPGGDFPANTDDADDLAPNYAWAYDTWSMDTIYRMARAYGTRIDRIIGKHNHQSDPGTQIAKGLFEAELRYLVENEFAKTAEDVLKRRSKLYLHLTSDEQARVEAWFAARN
ncbi:glycerol-3-phosphate dehydrogenase [Erythrobacter sp. SCSIO 43205]|uniref:glycerol-3-phosphate dehydrogenase n=1 Tax=Erythrobacter sp. SCSIO 43205 TaxID=2779361 RepID=UPI001CA90BA9|nr:glycerol-3-phosphate dehydrogenase [Erythrobacter sp. SCSIO 43205]UAB77886.1 glycerol-3-phosphate dehydrogenase [Erythrobacter sp. SCSIO 43205]